MNVEYKKVKGLKIADLQAHNVSHLQSSQAATPQPELRTPM